MNSSLLRDVGEVLTQARQDGGSACSTILIVVHVMARDLHVTFLSYLQERLTFGRICSWSLAQPALELQRHDSNWAKGLRAFNVLY